MSISSIYEHIVNEITFNQLRNKQKSIGKLFPPFGQRVKDVAANGGVQMREMMPEHWHFTVTSGTKAGVKYDVYVQFVNIDEMIKKYAGDKSLWKADGSEPNYNLLAAEILNNVDMRFSCSCPADLYWGGAYIKTQRDAQFGRQEYRPPDIRNPHQYGAYCKHSELVAQVLPFYTSTFASFLKKYWLDEVNDTIELLQQQRDEFAAAGEELGKRAERGTYARGGRKAPEPPEEDEDEGEEPPIPPDEEEPPPNVNPPEATKAATQLPAKGGRPGTKRLGIQPEPGPKDTQKKGKYKAQESVNEDSDDPFKTPDEADIANRDEIIKTRNMAKRLGKCYELSGRFAMNNPDWTLVHGTITRQDGSGYTIKHAWVEKKEKFDQYEVLWVFDPVWDNKLPWEAYERLVGAKVGKRYPYEKLMEKLAKEQNWGPWNE